MLHKTSITNIRGGSTVQKEKENKQVQKNLNSQNKKKM